MEKLELLKWNVNNLRLEYGRRMRKLNKQLKLIEDTERYLKEYGEDMEQGEKNYYNQILELKYEELESLYSEYGYELLSGIKRVV